MVRRNWARRGVWLVVLVLCTSSCATGGKRRPSRPKPKKAVAAKTKPVPRGLGDETKSGAAAAEEAIAEPAATDFTRRGPSGSQELVPGEPLWILSGKSRVFHTLRPLKRVSLGHPSAAAVVILDARTFMVNAKELPERRQEETPGIANRTGMPIGRTLTREPHYIETTLYVWLEGERGMDAHTLVVADFLDEQVLLEVTVAELNRSAMEEHGIDIRAVQKDFIAAAFMGGGGGPGIATVPPLPNRPLLPLSAEGGSPNYAFIFPNEDMTVFFKVLQTEGLATVLAQPKLVAMSGQNAVFQVGGEVPIRIATGFATDIQFKPFGTLVNFLARVSDEGDIMLTVSPEVSEPDFSNTVEGIPTFRTRRASTSARLRNGETLVIGGLLQTRRQEEERGVPYLKDVPYLGWFFRQTRFTSETTELVVVVKPSLVHPLPPGVDVPLPTDRGPMRVDEIRTQPNEAVRTRPRIPALP